MRNLINFLLKNSYWFVFIFLELICFYLVFNNNSYQGNVFFKASNEVSNKVYSISGNISSYFGLIEDNQELLERNAELRGQIDELKNYLLAVEGDSIKRDSTLNYILQRNSHLSAPIIARVQKNSISLLDNYIIINKGTKDGITTDMGVMSHNGGIVGIVRVVGDNSSIVQSLLNSNSKFSSKKKGSSTAGILVWDGGDSRYARLTEYPKYEDIQTGDTIVTSGYSDFFPENLPIGVVDDIKSETDDNFYSLKVKLFTDFGSIKNVVLVKNTNDEIKGLEEQLKDVKK